ncbi:MAG: hypothetical protein QOG62_1074 [Thermoleophilaceae bacterium]|nr:hypothetical protein [Thermoleophilaceae bacterium]
MEASPIPRSARGRIKRPRALLVRMSDDRLGQLAGEGDAAAFAVIYDRHAASLLSYAAQLLGSSHEAEDVVQHTMLAAHRELEGPGDVRLKPWLYTVARNRALSILRTRREQPLEEVDMPAAEGVAGTAERSEELRAILGDLARLPEDQRTALVLAELGDLSHEEIGAVLSCPARKVKALVFQARTALMAGRQARDTDCSAIREQLATLTGAALRRREIREHLRVCEGCREFRDEVRAQRAQLALLLPIVPGAGLREAVLGTIGAGGAGGAAALAGGGASLVGGKVVAALVAGGLVAAGVGVGVSNSGPGQDRPGPAREPAPIAGPERAAADAEPADGGGAKHGGDHGSGGRQDRHGSRAGHGHAQGGHHSGGNDSAPAAAAPVAEAPAPSAGATGSEGSQSQSSSAPGQIRATEVSKGANGAAQSSAHSSSGGSSGSQGAIHSSNAGGGGGSSAGANSQGSAHANANSNAGGNGGGASDTGNHGSAGGGKPDSPPGGGKPDKTE